MAQKQMQGESPATTVQPGDNEGTSSPLPIHTFKTSRPRRKSDVDSKSIKVQSVADLEVRRRTLMTVGSGDDDSHEFMRVIFDRQLNLQADQSLDTVIAWVRMLRAQFHQLAAAALTPALNRYLESVPQDTLEQKQKLATHINELVASVGLAVCCPGSNNPSTLIADWAKERKYSRFKFDVHLPEGGRDRVDIGCKKLENIVLIENPRRVESRSARFRNRPTGPGL